MGTKALGPIGLNLVGLFYLEKTMRRECSFFIVIAAVLALCLPAEAQQPGKIPRIGYVTAASPITASSQSEAFREALRKLGYVDGKNIVIEWRYADGRSERGRGLVVNGF